MVSRFFASRPPASPAAAERRSPSAAASEARLPSNGTRGKLVVIPARLRDAAKQAGEALDLFRAVARKKNAHTEHSDAAECVLIPFRPFARAKADAEKAAKDGDVAFLCVEETSPTCSVAPPAHVSIDASHDETRLACLRDTHDANHPTRLSSVNGDGDGDDAPGAAESGAVLLAALTELERLHVNASCRVRQRAPAVAEARARLTALRRECRDTFRLLNARGFERAMQNRARRKRNLPAARDAREFARLGAAESIAEVRNRCALMRETGSPHHLCVHLCYYREYDAARRLFVLRTRLAAATGSAAALDGWRAELRAASAEEMGARDDSEAADEGATARVEDEPDPVPDENELEPDFLDPPDEDEEELDGLFEAFRSPTPSPASSPAKSLGPARTKKGAERRSATAALSGAVAGRAKKRAKRSAHHSSSGAESGWLSARSLPWRVSYVSPVGERLDDPAEVLERLGCPSDATLAAAAAAGGGGFGVESAADFDGFEEAPLDAAGALENARRDPAGARAEGRVVPPRRRVTPNLSVGGSHGGSGVRLARPDERGLDEAADVLRAALWPKELDDEMCTEPVRLRLLAARAGAPRSPVRVAAPYDPDETFHETSTSETVRDSSLKGGSSLKDENRDAHAEGADDTIAANANALANARSGPVRSPFGLLEEILWADEWKMLVACMMLNCTTRVQVDRVLWRLFATTPTARAAVALGREGPRTASRGAADDEKDADGFSVAGASLLEAILAPLGLHRKRARAFVRLSEDYLRARLEGEEEERERDSRATRDGSKRSSLSPQKVSTLHGVGAYASDAHALFCENVLGVAPRDHALRWWYAWAIERREGERRKAAERRRAGKE